MREAEFLLEESARIFNNGRSFMGFEEKFDGVVAGFAMDIDTAGEVGRKAVVRRSWLVPANAGLSAPNV